MIVSIICTAYNHEKYIKYAIDGFLMQKTNFEYEILIHDDASTDNTPKILKEYQDMYPDLIKVIYQKENQYTKGVSAITVLLEKAKGKYLAFCEGDDYWIDKYKLQKQVDFLDRNIDYSAVYHNVKIVDKNNKLFDDQDAKNAFPFYDSYTLPKETLLIGYLNGQLGSLVCCNFWKNFTLKNKLAYKKCKANGDVKINLVLNYVGKIKYLKDVMSCYRRTYTGDSYNARNKNKDFSKIRLQNIYTLKRMIEDIFFIKISEKQIRYSVVRLIGDYLANFIKNRNKNSFVIFFDLYKNINYKLYFNYYFINRIIKFILVKINFKKRFPQKECIS